MLEVRLSKIGRGSLTVEMQNQPHFDSGGDGDELYCIYRPQDRSLNNFLPPFYALGTLASVSKTQ